MHDCKIEEHLTCVLRSSNSAGSANAKEKGNANPRYQPY
ncbi:Hypothetical protein RY67_1418 [Bifidobacterium longum subsp. infantis]|uniref:Uncharacterized protein n=1 Tax=Bifidobacterium longum subsp. infantis TaxID=1682 RepID=A0A0M4LIA7_BIFLI|nr:Hypothetical protein RY67_1418 [Bifidobacterium longum subsp. infantis]